MGTEFTEHVTLLLSQATSTVYRGRNGVVDPKAYAGTVGPNTYVASEGDVEVLSEPALLLERLYAGADPKDRASFGARLWEALNEQNARVVARTLAATRNFAPLAETTDMKPGVEELWRGFIHVLRFESGLFSDKDLETVMAAARRAKELARAFVSSQSKAPGGLRPGWIYRQLWDGTKPRAITIINTPFDKLTPEALSVVERIRYLRLAKNIRAGRNPAVDTDRQVLLSRLQAMGFSDSLSIASNEIEHRTAIALTGTDVKAVMDLLRSFYENFVKEACGKVQARVGKSVPSGTFQPYKQYLENAGLLVSDESAVLQSLYNFLSNQAAHKLSTAPEQLRVAHATVIEWCMMLAGRIEAFLANP